MDKAMAQKRAKEFADDLLGIVGQLPMERVVARHVGFFQELRAVGVTWSQISDLMKNAGVRRKSGKPVTPEQWTLMVARSRNDINQADRKTTAIPVKDSLNVIQSDNLEVRRDNVIKTTKNPPKERRDSQNSDIRSRMAKAARARNK